MPSFDIVSEINHHELTNACDQTNREINTRFDLKGSGAKVTQDKDTITISANEAFHVDQVEKVLLSRIIARKLDAGILANSKENKSLASCEKIFTLQEGIDAKNGKRINKLIKESKLKAQSSILDNKVRVTAKKIDDLRTIMDFLKQETFDMPLQFNNFRD